MKDSQNLIQICSKVTSKSKVFLYSCDFDSLYTNINPQHATNILTDYIVDFFQDNIHLKPLGFKSILELIFENNFFRFRGNFFKQSIGLPMGCKCGPSVANLYLYLLEKSWIFIHKPLIYARLIDDIFYASTTPLDLNLFSNHFGYLKLNIVEGETVNFLDLYISYDELTNKFVFDLYTKPTNTFSYLLPSSNHPVHIFKNIPKSLFIRIRRICSSYLDYLANSRNLCVQLAKRDYNLKEVFKICRIVGNIDRNSLIPYHQKNQNIDFRTNILFVLPFDKTFTDSRSQIVSSFKNIVNTDKLNNLKVKPVNNIQSNLGSILIHNRSFQLPKKYFTKPCYKANCKICNYTVNHSYST